MLDTFSSKGDLQLVVDQANFGILTHVSGFAVANAVSAGIQNTSIMNVLILDRPEFSRRQYRMSESDNLILVRKFVNKAFTYIPCDGNVALAVPSTSNSRMFDVEVMQNISHEWMERRKLANIRAEGFTNLEQKIERYMCRVKMFSGDEIFIPFMARELERDVSPAIIEWAEIQGITEMEARADLEIRVKTTQYVVSKFNAVWEKYVKKINNLYTSADITNCLNDDVEAFLRSGNR